MAERKRKGTCCLFVFALVCKPWRKAQLKVGGPLRSRVCSDVILPGRVALVKWALAEGCPRYQNMATVAAQHGRTELVKWLCGEQGFAIDPSMMNFSAEMGNLELVRWLRDAGCPWRWTTCRDAVYCSQPEVLRWARENGCPWTAFTRDIAARNFGYTDDFGNLVDWQGNPVQ